MLLDDNFRLLKDKEIILFPDLKAEEYWRKVAKRTRLKVLLNTYLMDKATDEERKQGLDIADYILRDTHGELCRWYEDTKNNKDEYSEFIFEMREREAMLLADTLNFHPEKINHLAWSCARHHRIELNASDYNWRPKVNQKEEL